MFSGWKKKQKIRYRIVFSSFIVIFLCVVQRRILYLLSSWDVSRTRCKLMSQTQSISCDNRTPVKLSVPSRRIDTNFPGCALESAIENVRLKRTSSGALNHWTRDGRLTPVLALKQTTWCGVRESREAIPISSANSLIQMYDS